MWTRPIEITSMTNNVIFALTHINTVIRNPKVEYFTVKTRQMLLRKTYTNEEYLFCFQYILRESLYMKKKIRNAACVWQQTTYLAPVWRNVSPTAPLITGDVQFDAEHCSQPVVNSLFLLLIIYLNTKTNFPTYSTNWWVRGHFWSIDKQPYCILSGRTNEHYSSTRLQYWLSTAY